MNTIKTLKYFLLAAVVSAMFQSCKDNILTPVANNKPLDSVQNLIKALNASLISINSKDKSFQIQLAQYSSEEDSLNLAIIAASNLISNGVNTPPYTAQYTIYLIDGGSTITTCTSCRGSLSTQSAKIAGVDGATVVMNTGGKTYTATSADGRVIFNNMPLAGPTTVTITAPGYTSTTYTTLLMNYTSSNSFNASTNILMLPTTGSNVTTYQGKMYINTSIIADTLGNVYNDATDATNYGKFVSQPGYFNDQIVYGYNAYNSDSWINPHAMTFTPLTTQAGINNVYAYPAMVSQFYSAGPNSNYTCFGDPITVNITGMTAFAVVDASGNYTIAVPSYQNNPGTRFAANGMVQNNYTYAYVLGNTINASDTANYNLQKITVSSRNWGAKPYILTKKVLYTWTGMANFTPFIIGDSQYTNIYYPTFIDGPGQTVTKDIYWAAENGYSGTPQWVSLVHP